MDGQTTIDFYQEIALLTGMMLMAARAREWDSLSALEQQCAAKVSALRAGDKECVLDASGREAKVRLINQILADDRAIRGLTEPWMAQLSALINSTDTERKLSQAYG